MSEYPPLRVANIILDGRFGGPQNRIYQVARHLKRDGIETTVILPDKGSEVFARKLQENGIGLRQLRLHRLTRQMMHLSAYLLLFVPEVLKLTSALRNCEVALVHCNSAWQIKSVLAARFAGLPAIWHLNDTEMPFLLKPAFKMLSANYCDAFIAAGQRVKSYYFRDPRLAGKPVRVINPPVDITHFDPGAVCEDQRLSKVQGLKIVTIGNINPTKGMEHFLQMAARLNQRYRGLNFFLVGPVFASQKKYSQKLKRLAQELDLNNLHFYGAAADVAPVLKSADIFVCTSLSESGPMTVFEAMSMAKPIVSTDVGDVSRFIRDGESGYVVPVGDAEILAAKVGLLIDDPQRGRFGQRARETAVRELDVIVCAKKHRQFYLEVMGIREGEGEVL